MGEINEGLIAFSYHTRLVRLLLTTTIKPNKKNIAEIEKIAIFNSSFWFVIFAFKHKYSKPVVE